MTKQTAKRTILMLTMPFILVLCCVNAYGTSCKTDCAKICTHTVSYPCIDKIYHPITTCHEIATDPFCVLRCQIEQEIACATGVEFDGCIRWRYDINYIQAVKLIKEAIALKGDLLSKKLCHDIAENGPSVPGLFRFAADFREALAALATTNGILVVGAVQSAKHAGHCACNEVFK